MNKTKTVVIFSTLHFCVTFFFLILSFSFGMNNFDKGIIEPSLFEHIIGIISSILYFPLGYLALEYLSPSTLPGLLGHIPMISNSLLWGVIYLSLKIKFKTA